MKKYTKIVALVAVLFLAGCAEITQWKPVLNTAIEKPEVVSKTDNDLTECKALASQASGFTTSSLTGTVAGAAGGAAEGAIIGSLLTGGASPATVVGAPVGAVLGLWYSGYEADKTFKRAFSTCLSQRGHFVIN